MYKISIFDKKFSHFIREKFNVYPDDCHVFSIWHFCPGTQWRALQSYFADNGICRAEWFPAVYWIVLIVSILGAAYSLYEFLSLMWTASKQVSIWRERRYFVLTLAVVRKCRLIGSLIMINVWVMLLYAVVYISPGHITPWLLVNMCILGVESFCMLFEVLLGVTQLDLNLVIGLGMQVALSLFVRCIKDVFQRAIETNDLNDLLLFKSFGGRRRIAQRF